ncbi:HAD family hydrolase [Candidatus Uhrbacteria bacterium CG10_big_fil_rev_8_21_14_0_10_50_16]|uniref:phosphomannomutase n=1 Tax=Candidatus Uhrbacteria bacterium CG10_big_fil_rev_8_21_14_0_10_50_16 TaxID=1975039 RepID=A0A2H0RLJ5_9BACT|nr:MAG: HAD family hydrolase [Candidatus Uhrbacteria bacterium CG10_big_fil_rev_8_21_14_0_10_50_16]
MTIPEGLADKRVFVFDLDGTLARSKTPMDEEMNQILSQLLKKREVAIIGGGWFPVFKWQLLDQLTCGPEELKHMHLMPTSGSRYINYAHGEWTSVYALELDKEERSRIMDAFDKAFKEINYQQPDKVYGEVIEDRGTQITYSALGQQAPVDEKEAWSGSEQDRRREIVAVMKPLLPEFEIKIPGTTSIDITREGVDKGYGVEQLSKQLGIPVGDMVFLGDALYEGGNDEPVKRTGIQTIAVANQEETKQILRAALAEME